MQSLIVLTCAIRDQCPMSFGKRCVAQSEQRAYAKVEDRPAHSPKRLFTVEHLDLLT